MQQTYQTNDKNIKNEKNNMLYKQMQKDYKNVKTSTNKIKTCSNNATNIPNKRQKTSQNVKSNMLK